MALRLSTGLRNKLLGINTEMILNGGFASATTSWTAITATLSSVASGVSGNCLQIAESGGADPGSAYQDITTIIGRLYKLSLYFKKGTADYGCYAIGTTGDFDAIYLSANINDAAWAAYTTYFVATATTTRITLRTNDATVGETSLFDSVSVVDYAHTIAQIFNLGSIDVYTGSQPSSADAAPTGSLLVTINNGGTGVTFDDAASGVLGKKTGETWNGTVVLAGTAGWARMRAAGDTNALSTTEERLDGAVAISGAEFNFPNGVSWALSSVEVLTSWQLTLPTA